MNFTLNYLELINTCTLHTDYRKLNDYLYLGNLVRAYLDMNF